VAHDALLQNESPCSVLSHSKLNGEKTIEMSPFFVIAAAETWLDGQPSEFFFEWLAKVRVWLL